MVLLPDIPSQAYTLDIRSGKLKTGVRIPLSGRDKYLVCSDLYIPII
jgi:hypothetical protein